MRRGYLNDAPVNLLLRQLNRQTRSNYTSLAFDYKTCFYNDFSIHSVDFKIRAIWLFICPYNNNIGVTTAFSFMKLVYTNLENFACGILDILCFPCVPVILIGSVFGRKVEFFAADGICGCISTEFRL